MTGISTSFRNTATEAARLGRNRPSRCRPAPVTSRPIASEERPSASATSCHSFGSGMWVTLRASPITQAQIGIAHHRHRDRAGGALSGRSVMRQHRDAEHIDQRNDGHHRHRGQRQSDIAEQIAGDGERHIGLPARGALEDRGEGRAVDSETREQAAAPGTAATSAVRTATARRRRRRPAPCSGRPSPASGPGAPETTRNRSAVPARATASQAASGFASG